MNHVIAHRPRASRSTRGRWILAGFAIATLGVWSSCRVETVSVSVFNNFVLPGPNGANSEAPPWLLGNYGGKYRYLVTSTRTNLCHDPHTLLATTTPEGSPLSFAGASNCPRKLRPAHEIFPTERGPFWGGLDPFWAQSYPNDVYRPTWIPRKAYHGAFAGHVIQGGNGDTVLITFNHSENVNHRVQDNGTYQNSVVHVNREDCVQDFAVGQTCWASYSAFVTIAATPFNENTDWGAGDPGQLWASYGPVVWPRKGYRKLDAARGWVKVNDWNGLTGVQHPSSFIHDGFIYLFYLEENEGVMVARANVASSGLPGYFHVFRQGSGFTEPALPAGFDQDHIENFLHLPGPTNGTLILDDPGVNRFSVARIRGTGDEDLFLGVETYLTASGGTGVALRVSPNLTSWSEREVAFETTASASSLYSIPLDNTGTTNSEVDLNDFYVVGTTPAPPPYRVWIRHVSAKIVVDE